MSEHLLSASRMAGLDPHPPIYFRVDRLERLGYKKVKPTVLQSIKDVIRGVCFYLRS